MINILITGANGQLGTAIKENLTSDFNYIFTDKHELDVANYEQCHDFIKNNKINYIINCAAYTAVDLAETNKEIAYMANSQGAENLAKIANQYNSKLIHISTDYVYSGNNTKPYTENDATSPVNYYGQTKLAAEQFIIKNTKNYIIIRSGWLYYASGKNFFNTIMHLTKNKNELKIVSDQYGTPTFCGDLANLILNLIKKDLDTPNNDFFGNIYNYSNTGLCTWYDFAVLINQYANNKCNLIPITTPEYPLPAKRPHYSVLDKNKIQRIFNIEIPSWQDGLKRCFDILTK